MSLPLHLDPYGLPIDIVARSIDKDDLTPDQKAERAFKIGLPIADPEVLPCATRWVADADEQKIKSEAIEQLRAIARIGLPKKRGSKIKETPELQRPLWDDSDDSDDSKK